MVPQFHFPLPFWPPPIYLPPSIFPNDRHTAECITDIRDLWYFVITSPLSLIEKSWGWGTDGGREGAENSSRQKTSSPSPSSLRLSFLTAKRQRRMHFWGCRRSAADINLGNRGGKGERENFCLLAFLFRSLPGKGRIPQARSISRSSLIPC